MLQIHISIGAWIRIQHFISMQKEIKVIKFKNKCMRARIPPHQKSRLLTIFKMSSAQYYINKKNITKIKPL